MDNVTIYTDGSCHGNPGAGGYAAVALCNGVTREVHGSDWYTTNNRMELMAVIEGLRLLSSPSRVKIVTDSKYVANQINRGNLRAYVNTPGRKNADLWQLILQFSVIHELTAEWVRGHSGNKLNQRCDSLANMEASRVEQEKEIRMDTFSDLLKDNTLTAKEIADCHHHPLQAVRKYHTQFFSRKPGGAL